MTEYNKRKEILWKKIYDATYHEMTEGETGQLIKKEIDEELDKLNRDEISNWEITIYDDKEKKETYYWGKIC